MKHSTAFAVVASALMIPLVMQAGTDSITWTTVAEALDNAPKQNRKIIMDVYTDWCGWCKRMDKDTYADPDVAAYISEKFIAAKMNPEQEGKLVYKAQEFTQSEFGRALQITGYPATVFFDEKGEVLTVVPGYIKGPEFLKILKYFGDDHYKTSGYEEYSKSAN